MSQLDLSTYVNQLGWFLIIYFIYYIIINNLFLTEIIKIVKVRFKMTQFISTNNFFNKIIKLTELNNKRLIMKYLKGVKNKTYSI